MLLIERLRAALAPDYEVERELAGGGMGIVFVARQRRLDRPVAIKLLRPELATAIAAERFLVEGRLLAKLSHPNIVPVYDAGEADGLLYYVMELIDGESLAERLERGALSAGEALDLTRDLLAALGTAHTQGVVHRDIKPANIFLRHGQALLGDFGIASWRSGNDPGLTTPGQMIGTPRYMAPEQRDGSEATALADVYAAGMVVYEACAGARWPAYQVPGEADWRRVPRALVPPLKRALALAPAERWPDGSAFGQAIAPARQGRSAALLGAAAVLVAIIAGILLFNRGGTAPVATRAGVTLALSPISVQGQPVRRRLGDSVRAALADALSGYPDFSVRLGDAVDDSLAIAIGGTVKSDGPALALHLTMRAPHAPSIALSETGMEDDWRRLADSLVNGLARAIWQLGEGADPNLPRAAIPKSDRGFSLWLKAEQYLSQARWDEADTAYSRAEQEDSTCYLCLFRRLDIDRWVGKPQDAAVLSRLSRVRASFPPRYQSLIHAALTPLPARLDTLRRVAEKYPDFFLASFEHGDELFHRGPLHGYPRSDAIEPLRATVQLRPRFGPGWEHLTWVLLSEGDSAVAVGALAGLEKTPPSGSGLSAGLHMLFSLGMRWKFFSPDSAERFSRVVLSNPSVIANKEAVAGARLLMTTDTPNGAVELGRMLTTMWAGRTDAKREGLLGQMYGFAALGRLDSLRAVSLRFGRETTDRRLPLLALELEAVLRRFDPDSSLRTAPDLVEALRVYLAPGDYAPTLQWRAAWALGLLATGRSDSVLLAVALGALVDEPSPARMRRTIEAAARAARGRRGDLVAALESLPAPIGYEILPGANEDPLDDTGARLLAAEWLERLQRRDEALQALLWQEHLHHVGHLTGPPQRAEGSWAVGTLARWHRALLLGAGDVAARCSALASVERRWKAGEPRFVQRADTARAMIARDCKPS